MVAAGLGDADGANPILVIAQVQVEILEAQSTTQSDVLVYPVQEPLPDCAGASLPADGDAFAFEADFYAQDTLYPGEPVVIGEMGKLRDVTYAIVRFFPALNRISSLGAKELSSTNSIESTFWPSR